MEYDRSMVLQMCGRAGRPPFDDTGIVIIMTRRETVPLYENLLKGCETVESQLLSCVTEHLTAEIVQLNVSDIARAIEWMKCSYLYVRMKKNPEKYALKKELPVGRVEKHLQEICVQKVNELSQCQLIWRDEDGFLLRPLEPGKLMTKYYLKFDTMKLIMHASSSCSIDEALHIICRAEEFSWIQLRRTEKKLLNDINMDKDSRLRFHILGDKGKKKKRIQSREEKIFVMVNDCLTGDPLVRDLSISQDMNSICSSGCRIAKCMKDLFIFRKNYKGALHSMLLAKSLNQKLWDDSPYLLKQLPGIGMVTAKALQSMGVKSFETLAEADPRKIEIVTGRKYPFGNHIKESLLSLPSKIELKLEEIQCKIQRKSQVIVTLTRLSQLTGSSKRHYADMVVGVEEDDLILYHEKIRVDEFPSPYTATVLFSSPQQGNLTVKADLIFEEFIGIDVHQKLTLINTEANFLNKQEKKLTSIFPRCKDVFVIDDGISCTSKTPIRALWSSNESKGDSDSMPSFKLLDEELEEGDPSVEIEDSDCKIINESIIFKHIRDKAKNLPVFVSPNCEGSPSLEKFNLIRKRTRERQLEVDDALDNHMQPGRNKILRKARVDPPVEPLKVEQHGENVDTYPTRSCRFSSDTIYSDDSGKLTSGPEEGIASNITEQRIFEHIRSKAKKLQMFDKLVTTESKTRTERGFSEDCQEICVTKQNEALQDDAITLDQEPIKTAGITLLEQGYILNPVLEVDKTMSSNTPLVTAESRGSTESTPKRLHSPNLSTCLLATVSEVRKIDSCLNFKSIFSFL